MRDIRYKWNAGLQSVGISNEVELPQFRVLGHRQRHSTIHLSTGRYPPLISSSFWTWSRGSRRWLWIIYWLVVTLYCHTRLVHAVIYEFDMCVELFPVLFFFFFYFYLHSTCLSVHVYNIYIIHYIVFVCTLSFRSVLFFLIYLFFSFLFFLVFLLVFAPICTDHRVALYREHLSIVPIKEEVRTKPVPGANSFDQSTDRPINQPHRNHGT